MCTGDLFTEVKQNFWRELLISFKQANFLEDTKKIGLEKNLGGVKDAFSAIFFEKKDGSNSNVLLVTILHNVSIKLVKSRVHVLLTPEC